jgi:hypothetical protein
VSLVFADSFGHYATADILAKWTAKGDVQIVNNAAIARTNSRCLQLLSGSECLLQTLAAHYTQLIQQVAFRLDSPNPAQSVSVMQFRDSAVSGVDHYNIGVRLQSDGTVSIWRGSGDSIEAPLQVSTLRPFVWGTAWNYFECACLFNATMGTVVLRVNGRTIISLSGIRTVAQASRVFTDQVELFGNGGNNQYYADYALIDSSVSPNNSFISQTKIYVEMPTANASASWTPLAGTNFSEVNEIPPDGDTSYNFSANVGDVDQYVTGLTGVPAAANIAAVQHCMDMKVDSGARTVASVVGGSVGDSNALTTSYVIYPFPYDQNPLGPANWDQSQFPVNFGPKVTA